jgi:hypothetical protein
MKVVEEVEPMANCGAVPRVFVGLTESCAQGVEEPTPTKPALVKVVVAVPPIYAAYAESKEDDAFENCWSAVQVFALPRLSAMVELAPPMSAPRVPVTVRVEFADAKEVVATD